MKMIAIIKDNKKKERINKGAMYMIYGMYSILFFMFTELYYRQSVSFGGRYPSDLGVHLQMGINGEAYSLVGIIFKVLYNVNYNTFYIALFLSAVTVGTIYATYLLLKYLIGEVNTVIIHLSAIALNFVIAIYIPTVNPNMYLGIFSPSVWHNSTYTGMKLIAILVVYIFFRIWNYYLEGICWKEWVVFMLLLVLVNAVKPNFVISFAPAMALVLLGDLIKTKGKGIKNIIFFGCAILPSLIIPLFQYTRLFDSTQGTRLVIDFACTTKLFTENYIIAIVQPIIFPLFILIFNREEIIRDKKYGFIWLMWSISFMQYMFLAEVGERAMHANWVWGYAFGIFAIFIVSIYKFYNNLKDRNKFGGHKTLKLIYGLVGIGLFGMHLINGLYYFSKILYGGDYL